MCASGVAQSDLTFMMVYFDPATQTEKKTGRRGKERRETEPNGNSQQKGTRTNMQQRTATANEQDSRRGKNRPRKVALQLGFEQREITRNAGTRIWRKEKTFCPFRFCHRDIFSARPLWCLTRLAAPCQHRRRSRNGLFSPNDRGIWPPAVSLRPAAGGRTNDHGQWVRELV